MMFPITCLSPSSCWSARTIMSLTCLNAIDLMEDHPSRPICIFELVILTGGRKGGEEVLTLSPAECMYLQSNIPN